MKLIDYEVDQWRDVPLIPGDIYGPSVCRERTHTLTMVAALGDFDFRSLIEHTGQVNQTEYAGIPPLCGQYEGCDGKRDADGKTWILKAKIREASVPRWPMRYVEPTTMKVTELTDVDHPSRAEFVFLPIIPAEMHAKARQSSAPAGE